MSQNAQGTTAGMEHDVRSDDEPERASDDCERANREEHAPESEEDAERSESGEAQGGAPLDVASRVAAGWSAIVDLAMAAAQRHASVPEAERAACVKTVRKATKSGRSLIRMLHGAMSHEARSGAERLLGDAASLLSAIRDRDAMIDAIDRLLEGKQDARAQQARLLLISIVAHPPVGDDQFAYEVATVRRAAALIARANDVIGEIPSEALTCSVAAEGMARLWRSARRKANREWQHDGEKSHDVRKAASRLVHQLNLIEQDLPKQLRKFRQRLRRATSALGEEHDLAILAECIALHRGKLGATFSEAVLQVCRRGRNRLREQAGVALAESMTLRPRGLARAIEKTYRA